MSLLMEISQNIFQQHGLYDILIFFFLNTLNK